MQTLLRKWAYAMPSRRNSDTRAADLPMWLRHYNHKWRRGSFARQVSIAWLAVHLYATSLEATARRSPLRLGADDIARAI